MNKKRNTILLGIVIGLFLIPFSVKAMKPLLHVWSTTKYQEIGDSFDINVNVNPGDENVCVIEGRINLSKLSCQSITLENGILALDYPTCQSPDFLIGILNCTNEIKELFTIEAEPISLGEGSVSFSNVDIISEGYSVPFTASEFQYDISAAPSIGCDCGEWGEWKNGMCGEGDCLQSQQFQSRTRNCSPDACAVEYQAQCLDNESCSATSSISVLEEEGVTSTEGGDIKTKGFLANLSAFFQGENSTFVIILIVSILITAGIFGYKKWKKKKEKLKVKKYER